MWNRASFPPEYVVVTGSTVSDCFHFVGCYIGGQVRVAVVGGIVERDFKNRAEQALRRRQLDVAVA